MFFHGIPIGVGELGEIGIGGFERGNGQDAVVFFSIGSWLQPYPGGDILDIGELGLGMLFSEGDFDDDTAVGIRFALVGDKVAEGVSGPGDIVFFFYGLDDMGVSADDEVGAPGAHFSGQIALGGVFGGLVFVTPVHDDDDEIGIHGFGGGKILLDAVGIDEVNDGGFFGGDTVGAVGIV